MVSWRLHPTRCVRYIVSVTALDSLAEAINDGFVAVDAEWRVTHLNRRARLLLRRQHLDDNLRLQDLIPDDPATTTWRELNRALKHSLTVELEVFQPAFFSWHEVRAFPLDGGLGLILRDITDRQWLLHKDTEHAYLRTLFNDAPVGLYVTHGPDHRFDFANTLGRHLAGNRNIEGLNLREAFPDLDGQGYYELFDRVYQTGEDFVGLESPAQLTDPHTGEVRNLYVNFHLVPLRGFDGKVSGLLDLAIDVTKYVQARETSG